MTARWTCRTLLFAAACMCTLGGLATVSQAEEDMPDAKVYELRIYKTNEGKLDALHRRFRDHTMAIFARHGMENVFYSTPVEEPDSENTLVYFIAHKSRDAAKESWSAFGQDPEWRKVARESEQDGRILAERPTAEYLAAADFSPEINPTEDDAEEGVFELRRYTTAEGRLPNLLQRFRDGELELFVKHGMTNIAYWTPVETPDTLVYVVKHRDQDAAKKSWQGFLDDPDWKELHAASLESGPIVIKVENQFLKATDYSPTK